MTKIRLAVAAGEGIYWKYESLLKKLDSEFYSVVGAAGELFSIKTALFHESAEDIIIEDFVQSSADYAWMAMWSGMNLTHMQPNRLLSSMREEQKRKVRIAAGAFQSMVILKSLFNVFQLSCYCLFNSFHTGY